MALRLVGLSAGRLVGSSARGADSHRGPASKPSALGPGVWAGRTFARRTAPQPLPRLGRGWGGGCLWLALPDRRSRAHLADKPKCRQADRPPSCYILRRIRLHSAIPVAASRERRLQGARTQKEHQDNALRRTDSGDHHDQGPQRRRHRGLRRPAGRQPETRRRRRDPPRPRLGRMDHRGRAQVRPPRLRRYLAPPLLSRRRRAGGRRHGRDDARHGRRLRRSGHGRRRSRPQVL